MSFNSTTFIFFLVGVYFTYWGIARFERTRIWFLLVMSCAFYMSWNAKLILLVLLTAVIDYCVALALARTDKQLARRALLFVTLASNLGVLGFFKYANFFAENAHRVAEKLGRTAEPFTPWDIILPVGISFYTFQTLSYTIDVYKRKLEPCRSFPKFLLFITFFPQLVAGPIVRAVDFLPQLELEPRHDDNRALRGVFLVLTGLIKKVALADTLGAQVVDPLFANPDSYGSFGVVLAGWSGWLQLYLDFSAYSDIAIGSAAMLGFVLPKNFDRPFMAQSVGEFWRRWHISLSTWFRDYVFIPLGGRHKSFFKYFAILMSTMLLSGLWHGAGWNYVIWGLLLGLFAFLGNVFFAHTPPEAREARPWWLKALHRFVTFNLLGFAMIFFRNGTTYEHKAGFAGSVHMLKVLASFTPAASTLSTVGLAMFAATLAWHYTPIRWFEGVHERWHALPAFAQALVLVLFTGILGALSYQQRPFIYFQF